MISINQQKICMLLLAIYPIINYFYIPPITFGYGTILLVAYIIYVSFKIGITNIITLPKYFVPFWLYIGIITIVLASSFNPTFLLPGGSHIFLWILCLGASCKLFNVDFLKKYLRIIFIISTIVFIIQFIILNTMGENICMIPPLSNNLLYRDFTYPELVTFHMLGNRPSSIFMEPAYFAQYILILLTIELFGKTTEKRASYMYIICMVVVLFLIRSGSGMTGLAFLLLLKFFSVYLYLTTIKKIFFLLLIVPILYFGISLYFNSEYGSQMLDRKEELSMDNTGSSGFTRMIGGFVVYDKLPTINKIFGCNNEEAKKIARNSIGYEDGMLFNGVQSYLVNYGLIGMFLLVLIYYNIYRMSTFISKAAILILLFISFIEYTFFNHLMLLFTAIAYGSKINYKIKSHKFTQRV